MSLGFENIQKNIAGITIRSSTGSSNIPGVKIFVPQCVANIATPKNFILNLKVVFIGSITGRNFSDKVQNKMLISDEAVKVVGCKVIDTNYFVSNWNIWMHG